MKLELRIDAGAGPGIDLGGRTYVDSIRIEIPHLDASGAECVSTPWEWIEGNDALGPYDELRSVLSCDGSELIESVLRNYGTAAVFTTRFLRAIEGIGTDDSFERPSVCAPTFAFPKHLRTCLATHGLRGSDDPFGGYWPTATIANGKQLPPEAFAPLVIYDADVAVAVAPSNQFLTGSLVAVDGGVARSTHGSIDRFEEGMTIETLFVPGTDVPASLMALGDILLKRGGKQRPVASSHPVTSSIGWWNAYGGYYTEPIHPLAATELRDVIEGLRARSLPIGYLGLDLWYPYREIGQGIEFAPDAEKYPEGIGEMARAASLPTVLHVSALAQPNAYGSDGSDGSIYEAIGDEIRRQGGLVVWHDWMRSQQHLTSSLRNSPTVAETWYETMTGALADRGLDVLQCMQTMGMALASTRASNVRCARSSIDYLFALPEAIETLANLGDEGFRREALRPIELDRQNLLMGMFLYAFGLLPFHDLFLTRFHPGIGGSRPVEDAVLRALSCGPVGIGDAPGRTDAGLLGRLVRHDGRLLRPDRPPFPVTDRLGEPIEVYWTEHRAGEHAWLYVVLLNLTTRRQSFDIAPPVPGDYVVRDGLRGGVCECIEGELEGGSLAYYILSPRLGGVSPLGLTEKLVPAPADGLADLAIDDDLAIVVHELDGPFGFHCESPIEATADGAPLPVANEGELHTVTLTPSHSVLRIRRR